MKIKKCIQYRAKDFVRKQDLCSFVMLSLKPGTVQLDHINYTFSWSLEPPPNISSNMVRINSLRKT